MAEWVTGRLDVAPETAKALVTTARRLEALPTVQDAVAEGTVSFDRTTAVARIAEPSEDTTIIDELAVYDVARIRRLRSKRYRTSREMERRSFAHRYMTAQPNLDETSWRVHGELPGLAGRSFVDALDHKANSPGWRDVASLTHSTTRPTNYPPILTGATVEEPGGRMLCGRSASTHSQAPTAPRSRTRHRC